MEKYVSALRAFGEEGGAPSWWPWEPPLPGCLRSSHAVPSGSASETALSMALLVYVLCVSSASPSHRRSLFSVLRLKIRREMTSCHCPSISGDGSGCAGDPRSHPGDPKPARRFCVLVSVSASPEKKEKSQLYPKFSRNVGVKQVSTNF